MGRQFTGRPSWGRRARLIRTFNLIRTLGRSAAFTQRRLEFRLLGLLIRLLSASARSRQAPTNFGWGLGTTRRWLVGRFLWTRPRGPRSTAWSPRPRGASPFRFGTLYPYLFFNRLIQLLGFRRMILFFVIIWLRLDILRFAVGKSGRRQYCLVLTMAALNFRPNGFRSIVKGKFAITMLANVFEQHLQARPAVRAIEIHAHRIQRQRYSAVTFATGGFDVDFFAHSRSPIVANSVGTGDSIFLTTTANPQNHPETGGRG